MTKIKQNLNKNNSNIIKNPFIKTNDPSNNQVFLFPRENYFKNPNLINLHTSKHHNLYNNRKLITNFSNNEKNNINYNNHCNEMKKNKLVENLDKKYKDITCQTNNIENQEYNTLKNKSYSEDVILQMLLSKTSDEFFKNYNKSLFSGIPTNVPIKLSDNFDTTLKSHKVEEKNIIKEVVKIETTINDLNDIINLCDKYPLIDNVEYNINMKAIHNIKPCLIELNNMIGMKSIKENVVDQILYFIQDLHNLSPNNSDYMHTVIYGPPGTGKTEVAKIIGKLFSKLGILENNVFKKVTRDDLVAGYLGQTAMKTKNVIKECIGGVLFIDEAYSLGNKEKLDSFSKESIDTICEALSDHKKDLMCIIAGYEDELKDCFFNYNPGLESRFTWKFKIDDYNNSELRQIFEKKITDCGWTLKEPLHDGWFSKNKSYFKYCGRDMETLFSKVKLAHSRRIFCLPKEEKAKITMNDLEKGFNIYKNILNSDKNNISIQRLKEIQNTIYC